MLKKIIFCAGCFWGVQQVFDSLKGVKDTTVGYSGGNFVNPSYEDVCSGTTGHAEAVLVEYEDSEIKLEDLLRVFWKSHNPTTVNRQGPDIGSQYRSAIFFYDEEDKKTILQSKQKLEDEKRFLNPIVTEIMPANNFYKAEEYHQKYFEKRGGGGCHIV